MSHAQEQGNEMVKLVVDALTRLLQEQWLPLLKTTEAHNLETAEQSFWQQLHESGFLDILLSAEAGGAELPFSEIMPVMQVTGAHALSLPFVSTVLGRGWLEQNNALARVGAADRLGFARAQRTEAGRLHINESDLIAAVDWVLIDVPNQQNHDADRAIATFLLPIASLEEGQCAIQEAELINKKPVCTSTTTEVLSALGHSALLTGVAQRSMELTLEYARQRTQFGRSIGRFQAIQSQLSEMAEQFFAMDMATRLAFSGWQDTSSRLSRVAMAKLVSSEAAFKIATVAHAVHGAIGMTQEYELQCYTRLLYQWRRAGGAESYWARKLGAEVLNAPQEQASALDFILTRLSAQHVNEGS